jgi:tyrosine-protein phosphatase SIW14
VFGWCLVGTSLIVIATTGTEFLHGRPYAAEHLQIDGIENAGRVTAHLYRGAQPSRAGFRSLKALGVDTVVSFTLGRDELSAEKNDLGALGIRYVHLPWSTMHDPPAEHVRAFLSLFREFPNQTVFVHCKAGVDRTGVMVAAYRIALEHWRPDQAVAEMNAFHFRSVFLPHLARYVTNLPSVLEPMAQLDDSAEDTGAGAFVQRSARPSF